MIESQEAFTFRGEANPFMLVRLNEFFEGKQMLGEVPIPDQVNSLELSFAEERFDDILASIRVSYDAPYGEGHLFLLHATPPTRSFVAYLYDDSANLGLLPPQSA